MEDAHEAITRGDWDTAYKLLKPLAEKGNASAQNDIAFLYSEGFGVQQDYTKADEVVSAGG